MVGGKWKEVEDYRQKWDGEVTVCKSKGRRTPTLVYNGLVRSVNISKEQGKGMRPISFPMRGEAYADWRQKGEARRRALKWEKRIISQTEKLQTK